MTGQLRARPDACSKGAFHVERQNSGRERGLEMTGRAASGGVAFRHAPRGGCRGTPVVVSLSPLVLVLALAAETPDAGTSPALPPGKVLKRPRLLSAPPRPPEGLHIRGLVSLKCRVLAAGRLEDCVVLTSDGS